MYCVIYAQGAMEMGLLPMRGKFQLFQTEEEMDNFITAKAKAGFVCHRFEYKDSYTRETNVVPFKGAA